MNISWRNLKGSFTKLTNNNVLGYINEIYIKEDKVFAFEISRVILLFNSRLFVLCDEVESLNNNIMIANNVRTKIDLSSSIKGSDILFKEVYNGQGSLLGILNDIVFDSLNFMIQKFECTSSLFSFLKNEKIILNPEEIILKENKILS